MHLMFLPGQRLHTPCDHCESLSKAEVQQCLVCKSFHMSGLESAIGTHHAMRCKSARQTHLWGHPQARSRAVLPRCSCQCSLRIWQDCFSSWNT